MTDLPHEQPPGFWGTLAYSLVLLVSMSAFVTGGIFCINMLLSDVTTTHLGSIPFGLLLGIGQLGFLCGVLALGALGEIICAWLGTDLLAILTGHDID